MNQGNVGFNGISMFSCANNAQPVDQTIVLTPTQLQAIIEQAVRAATAPLVAEIELLKQRLDSLTNNHSESDQMPQIQHAEPSTPVANTDKMMISPPIPNPIITAQSLDDVKSELLLEIEKMYTDLQIEIAKDRQRITKLEKPVYGPRSLKRIDDLYDLMTKNKLRQVTFPQVAKLLGISYQHAKRLRLLIQEDSRFVVVNDPRHKTRRLIRLTDARKGGR